MNKSPIGMFDSGVGGLTVLKEVQKELPNETYVYLGDTVNFPYGTKSKEAIMELTKKGYEFCLQKGAKVFVIACGTATSQALDGIKEMSEIPVIGIIDATVRYIQEKTSWKKVGVIATEGTIRSKGWEKALKSVRPDLEVEARACPLLAPMAEEGWTNNEVARLTIQEYLKDLEGLDALILGCTHYPLFEDLIRKTLGKDLELINTGKMVAKELKEILEKENLKNEAPVSNQCEIYITDKEPNLGKMTRQILKDETIEEQIKVISLD